MQMCISDVKIVLEDDSEVLLSTDKVTGQLQMFSTKDFDFYVTDLKNLTGDIVTADTERTEELKEVQCPTELYKAYNELLQAIKGHLSSGIITPSKMVP